MKKIEAFNLEKRLGLETYNAVFDGEKEDIRAKNACFWDEIS